LLGEVDDVRPIIASADVVVLPSYREGLRVLCSKAEPWVARSQQTYLAAAWSFNIEKRAHLPRADADSLARAMLRLCENPSLIASFGTTARTDIEARFDEQKVIDNTLATYRRLFQANAKGPSETAAR
jgi:glycosyltransferase involved in cell wall biosynthesis